MSEAYLLAQATVLGFAITNPDQAAEVFAIARVEDFDPPYREVAEALHRLRLDRLPIDQLSVVDELTRRGTLGKVGGTAFVFDLTNYGIGGIAAAEYAAEIIATHVRRRRLWKAGVRLQHEVEKDGSDPYRLAKSMVVEAQGVVDTVDAQGEVLLPDLGDLKASHDAPYDWVIPGLLERGDRLVLTGTEGVGKSELLRQLAVSTASGVHPFDGTRSLPQRVVYIDCENGVPKLRRSLRALSHQGETHGSDPSHMMWIEARPVGLDLTRPEDEQWLVRVVANLAPALLVIGPAYRLHLGNPNDEELARRVADVLDRARSAANCALILEAHPGHGSGGQRPIRPTGSSLWLRWPEYGYGMRPPPDYDPAHRTVDFMSWRGDREARDWPTRLEAGGTWPWRAVNTWGS